MSQDILPEANMTRRTQFGNGSTNHATSAIGPLIHTAALHGLTVGRMVKIGAVRGIVIGYNIARHGRFPGARYPLLVRTELGTAKFGLHEVALA
jgi:hypothetical protein